MKDINILEKSLLEAVLHDNQTNYPFLIEHFQCLKLKDREYTGVGTFSNFEYSRDLKFGSLNKLLSSEKRLFIDGVENEVTYVLAITDGRIDFLELVTNNDEIWNGEVTGFQLI
jgi:hypothetical protein